MVTDQTDTQRMVTRMATGQQRKRGVRPVPRTLERDAELSVAQIALDAVSGRSVTTTTSPSERRGGLLAFTGPAGVGKTTLLNEVRRRAAERQCTGLFAKGAEQEQSLAFHVVRQLFQPLLASYSESERREVLGDWYGIVGPCVGLCPPAPEGAAPDPQGVRDGLDWVVTHVAVQRGPLILAVDDLHWADAESVAWLASFAKRVEGLPVLMVVAYRPDELGEVTRTFTDMAERIRARPLDLAPLSPSAVAELMREGLDTEADDSFCQEAWLVTGGNPFETVELVAKVRDRRLVPVRDNACALRDLAAETWRGDLVDRLKELGTIAMRLSWAVAVLGSEATPPLAASIAALGRAEFIDAADMLRTERILTYGPQLEFVHPLIARAIYRAIPSATRVALHGKAAWELVERGHGPAAAARHLLETQPEGDAWAAEQLCDAAREYVRQGAPEAARRCLSRALCEPPPASLRATVLYELGSPALMQDPAATVNHLRAALDEPGLSSSLRQSIVIRLMRALAYCDRLAEASNVATGEAGMASDSRVRLRMFMEHFLVAGVTSNSQEATVLSRRLTLLTGRLSGRSQTERYLFGLRGWNAMVRGEPAATALSYAERALGPEGMSWTDEEWGFEVPSLVALTFLYCDRPDRAEELYAAAIAEYERQGWRGVHLSLGYSLLGYIRFWKGQLTDAEDFVRAGLQLADRLGPGGTHAQCYALGGLIEILMARGETAAAQELAASRRFGKPFPAVVTLPDAQTVHGELLLARGLDKEACEELTEVGNRLDLRGMRNPAWCPWLPHLALASRTADAARAVGLAQDALRRAERFGTATAVGRALRVLARVTEGPQGIALLRRAVPVLETAPSSYELASALVELGTALRRAGRLGEAAKPLHRGVDLAGRCGAGGVAAQARDELVAAGLRPRRLDVTPPESP
ncbi:AAA ATPase-like protein [Streptomyces sp. SLBN-118]|uniref:ATP-binding protein n=1 Tax=Streptomyces sp. SLBN-118 TaxID=2768454 RepID=UPI0011512F15|nr:AAA family ATPase [Streptomyces sp. SLBN-118]TQK50159.1 AAA ATPase-like protein [Streptomyces sp. SLBN-118]